jgi:hypothetical protein
MAEIFLSYSHKDLKWVEQLKKALAPLIMEGTISLTSDTDENSGGSWVDAIKNSLNRAQAVIFILSPDYLASRLGKDDWTLIEERARKGKLFILIIEVSPTLSRPPLLKTSSQEYHWLNTEPLSTLSEKKQKEVFDKAFKMIRDAFSDDLMPDEISKALDSAIRKIGGSRSGNNILGGRNIFFEAEERLAKKDEK